VRWHWSGGTPRTSVASCLTVDTASARFAGCSTDCRRSWPLSDPARRSMSSRARRTRTPWQMWGSPRPATSTAQVVPDRHPRGVPSTATSSGGLLSSSQAGTLQAALTPRPFRRLSRARRRLLWCSRRPWVTTSQITLWRPRPYQSLLLVGPAGRGWMGQAARGGPSRPVVAICVQAASLGQSVGRCSTSWRAEPASLPGTLISCARCRHRRRYSPPGARPRAPATPPSRPLRHLRRAAGADLLHARGPAGRGGEPRQVATA